VRATGRMLAGVLVAGAAVGAACAPMDPPDTSPAAPVLVGRYTTGLGALSGETVAAEGDRMYVTNSTGNSLDVVSIADRSTPALVRRVDLSPYGAGPNSVDVADGLVAVAVEAATKTDPGSVVLFDAEGDHLTTVEVGSLPDMVTFTPDGRRVLVANEGEPDDDYAVDPEGSVSVVEVAAVRGGGSATVTTLDFGAFDAGGPRAGEIASAIRLPGADLGSSVAQDLEPEYVAVDADGDTAWVSLQENNALARLDLDSLSIDWVRPLGLKDHSVAGSGLDASDRDGPANGPAINIATWPVKGMYMPDAIAHFVVGGRSYLLSANEGDARDYDAFAEESRVGASGYQLDPTAFPDAAVLKANANLGRLTVTTASGDTDGDGDFDEIHAFGARSFSVWNTAGARVADSGDAIEQLVAAELPANFNANNEDNAPDTRSDNKGPEPEGATTGVVRGRTYGFVGLERIGGVLVVDLSDPTAPEIVEYLNTRDLGATPVGPDSGPEVLTFVPADGTPGSRPMLLVAHEVSGTVTLVEL